VGVGPDRDQELRNVPYIAAILQCCCNVNNIAAIFSAVWDNFDDLRLEFFHVEVFSRVTD